MKHIATLRSLDAKARTTYINLSVRNTAYNYLKKRQRLSDFVIGDGDIINNIPDQTNLEQQIILNEEINTVREALQKLPEKDQVILRMKYALELPDSEIAKHVGLSTNSIPKYVCRAREKLKKILYRDHFC